MAIANVPNIRDLGTVPDSNTMDEEEFSQTAEVFTGNMPGWGSDVHDVGVSAKTNAEHSQSQAQASASSAGTAATSANNAQTFANAAQASKDAAGTSALNAQQSATAAAASLLSMQMLYLGPKNAPPTTNNQGGPLTLGAWYVNTTNGAWYWWDGVAWKIGMSDPDVGTVTWDNVLNKPTTVEGFNITNAVKAADFTWANLWNKPSTLSGFGITDAVKNADFTFAKLLGKPTTLSGYGITDAVNVSGPQFGPPSLMADAPLGQWAQYGTVGGAPGADWPTTATTAWWNVFTIGASTRKTQRASQVLAGAQQGWVFERQLQDSTWSAWDRVFTAGSLVERGKYFSAAAPTYAIDPAVASVNWIDIYNASTINVPNPRSLGDQLTIKLSVVSASALTFSSNVKAPSGGLPALTAGTIMTLVLTARQDGTYWDVHGGGTNPW